MIISSGIQCIDWTNNGGYCGEMSLVIAGLYYGQYLSQFDVRLAGNGDYGQYSQLLLLPPSTPPTPPPNGSVTLAAQNLNLSTEEYESDTPDPAGFLAWIKGYIQQNQPVIIGVFANCSYAQFKIPLPGDGEYDHIIIVTGIGTDPSGDVLYYWDVGFWTPASSNPPAYKSSSFGTFPKNRNDANQANGPIYSLPAGGVTNYGVAITGISDSLSGSRVWCTSIDPNEEDPEIDPGVPPAQPPRPTRTDNISVTVSGAGLPAGNYDLYRHTSWTDPGTKIGQVTNQQPYTDTITPDAVPPTAIYRALN